MAVFTDKVVIITGASEGIGRALAIDLAPQRPKLVLAARNEERLSNLADECRALGAECLVVQTDVTEKGQCKNLIDKCVAEFGAIDVLVNNAGITMWAKFEDIDDDALVEKVMNVNYMSAVYCTRYALPYLKQTKGRIVAVSSVAGLIGVPGHAVYGASKHAMHGFFDSLRIELMDSGVSVSVIAPDFIVTEIHYRGLDASGKPMKKRLDANKAMSASECAKLMTQAIEKRQRMLITSARGRLARKIRDVFPGVLDYFSNKSASQHSLME